MLIANDTARVEHEWTVDEYFRLGEREVFGERRTELIGGKIYDMSPPGPEHSDHIMWLNHVLVSEFGATHWVRVQLPLKKVPHSAPEPDFSLLPRTSWKRGEHPEHADLVIEISDSSVAFDVGKKANLYATMGVPEYWVLNLKKHRLEIFRGPEPDADAPFGATYREKRVAEKSEEIIPVAFPDRHFSVGRLFP